MGFPQLGVRTTCFGPHETEGIRFLASLGIRSYEIRLPEVAVVTSLLAELGGAALEVTTAQVRLDFTTELGEQLAPALRAARTHRIRYLLTVTPPDTVLSPRLRDSFRSAGDLLAECGTTLLLETHPGLVLRPGDAVRHLAEIDHPAIRINFDPANLYYFGGGTDECGALRSQLAWVGGVHLKDTRGGEGERDFPELGAGRVDFRGLCETLREAEFDGPCTLELDGMMTADDSFAQVCERIRRSIHHWAEISGWRP